MASPADQSSASSVRSQQQSEPSTSASVSLPPSEKPNPDALLSGQCEPSTQPESQHFTKLPENSHTACPLPNVSGFTVWDVEASPDGSRFKLEDGASLVHYQPQIQVLALLLMAFRERDFAFADFNLRGKSSYGTINVPLLNHREDPTHPPQAWVTDLSGSNGLSVTYFSDTEVTLQLRHGTSAHGGHHHRVVLPAGQLRTEQVPWTAFSQPVGATPRYALDLTDAFALTFAVFESSKLVVMDLRIDGFTPPCPPAKTPPPRVIRGVLQSTKGAQGMLNGFVISPQQLTKWLGPDWMRTWRGQRVRVVAKTGVHVCDPQEQCLTSGRIPYLTEITSFERDGSP